MHCIPGPDNKFRSRPLHFGPRSRPSHLPGNAAFVAIGVAIDLQPFFRPMALLTGMPASRTNLRTTLHRADFLAAPASESLDAGMLRRDVLAAASEQFWPRTFSSPSLSFPFPAPSARPFSEFGVPDEPTFLAVTAAWADSAFWGLAC